MTCPNRNNCPINEQTADGVIVGRCWFALDKNHRCPRHGDVTAARDLYIRTGKLTLEKVHKP